MTKERERRLVEALNAALCFIDVDESYAATILRRIIEAALASEGK